jgi:hypothetical protein
LTVSSGTLAPAFAAGTTSYTVGVASGVGSLTVTAQAQDAGATVSINGQTTTSLLVTLGAPPSSTLITIIVTAPNLTQQTYTVLVNRPVPSSDAGLSSLTVSTGTLTPTFAAPGVSGSPGYTVAVLNGTTSITVTALAEGPNATLKITPSATVNSLPVGDTVITIVVTAEAGNSLTYLVTVTRAP